MSNQLTLVAFLRAKPGQEDVLGERLAALVAPTRQEAGCINYDLHRSNDDPAVWMLYENWTSREGLNLHFETPYLKDFLGDLESLLAADMDLRYFSIATQ